MIRVVALACLLVCALPALGQYQPGAQATGFGAQGAPSLALRAGVTQEKAADDKLVQQIVQEIELAPSLYARTEAPLKPEALPKFTAAKLAGYAVGDKESVAQHRKRWLADKLAYAKAFPMRAALFEAAQEADDLRMLKFPMALPAAGAPLPTPKQKAGIMQFQASLALAIFKLEQAHKQMEKMADLRNKQKILRWKADFDFGQARVQTNLIFLFECDYTLGQVRADALPKLAAAQDGWKIISRPKISVTETKAKDLAKTRIKLLKRIQEEYAETPWAFFAERESKRDLGMEWAAKRK
jgi:hypothetical protein